MQSHMQELLGDAVLNTSNLKADSEATSSAYRLPDLASSLSVSLGGAGGARTILYVTLLLFFVLRRLTTFFCSLPLLLTLQGCAHFQESLTQGFILEQRFRPP
jgi:hypothetical protein